MAKNVFLDWDTTASNNTDVGGIGILGTNAVSNFDDALRTVMAQLKSGLDGKLIYTTKSATYLAVANDNNGYMRFTSAATLNLTAAATLGANWHLLVVADGGDVTVDPNGAELINGAATLTIRNGDSALIICTGAAFFARTTPATLYPSYLVKTANYTALDTDFNASIRFTSAATLAFDVTANLRTNWRIEVWNDSTGLIPIDPDSTNTINGALTLVLQPGQKAEIFKTSATTFQASVFSDALSGPQLQGYVYGLAATTNAGTPNTNIDVAAGAAASSASPYYLIQLLASITKNTNNSWAVGSGQGSLDTGAIANSTYYGYLIQRSDTGVVDVITSLSSTSPTMPANYDRRSPALFTFTRTAGVNSAPVFIGRYRPISQLVQQATTSGTAFDWAVDPSASSVTLDFKNVGLSGTDVILVQLGTSGGFVTSGYDQNITIAVTGSSGFQPSSAGFSVGGGNVNYHANGTLTLRRMNGSNDWVASLSSGRGTVVVVFGGGGSISLSGALTQVRLTRSGSNTFSTGSVSGEFR